MRIDEDGQYIPFTVQDINNKQLIIKMLNYEEEFTKSNDGQLLYHNPLNRPIVSLTIEKTIHRIVLTKFGFDTSDESVNNYRLIFKTYYKSPDDYDKDVINAVHYMRENKCAYYKSSILEIGHKIPDCTLYHLDGKNVTTLYDIINRKNANHTLLAAFSLS